MSEIVAELVKRAGLNYAEVALPTTAEDIQRALREADITNGQDGYDISYLYVSVDFPLDKIGKDVDIYELNHLAEQFFGMDGWQKDCFEGLCLMESRKNKYEPLTLERLINLTLSTSECQVLYEAHNDKELGKFYAENDFIRELDNVPDKVMEWLDYAKIGAEMREAEGGVFTPQGYVVLNGEISTEYTSDMCPRPNDSPEAGQKMGGL